ncbi:MAG: efflux RND transporter periplasmic adaptor subunit, partial [Thermoleophilaceae bacterium]
FQLVTATMGTELAVQADQVERLHAIYDYQERRVESMDVTAGAGGVLQDLSLEVGQWVQSGTTLARVAEPGRLKAEVRIPQTQARDVAIGQSAMIDTRNDTLPGTVRRIDPNVQNGTVLVEVGLPDSLPEGLRPDLSVDGTIVIERLEDVLSVERPAFGQSESAVGVFKLVDGGNQAVRTTVQLGRGSVHRIEVVSGLEAGDRIILSDMSRWDDADRVEIE